MTRLHLTVACVLIASITGAFCQTPTPAQIESFSREIEAAWQSGSNDAFEKLYHKEGAEQTRIDTMVANWSQQKKNLPEATLTVKGFYDRAEMEKKSAAENRATGTFTMTLKTWDKPQAMNGHHYIPNLPVAGVFEIDIRGGKGGAVVRLIKAGLTKEGTLRFSLLRQSSDP
jgi:hypothetical protein